MPVSKAHGRAFAGDQNAGRGELSQQAAIAHMGWVQHPRRVTHHCYHGRCKRLNRERGSRPVRCGSAQVAILALCMRDAGQCGFDPRRQGLADDIGIEAAEVFADGSQKLLIRDYRFASSTLAHAAHRRLQVTVTVEVAGH
jgi:hypothetical protein